MNALIEVRIGAAKQLGRKRVEFPWNWPLKEDWVAGKPLNCSPCQLRLQLL
jgi:hypothetical protein